MNKSLTYTSGFVLLALFVLDRITKYWTIEYLSTGYEWLDGFFSLQYFQNTGIAFGIPIPNSIALIMAIGIIVILYTYTRKNPQSLPLFPVALIITGAISNSIDRIIYSHVIDFIIIWQWPAFNIADCLITIGAIWLIVNEYKQK